MARRCLIFFLIFVGAMVHVYGRSVDKRLLASDPNYLHNIEVKMQDMTQTIADLTQKYGDMTQKYVDLAHNNSYLAQKYTDMTQKYTDLKQNVMDLAHNNSDLAHKYRDVTQKYADLVNGNSDLQQKYKQLTHANGDLAAQLRQHNKTMEALLKTHGNQSNIYFDAYLTKNAGNLGLGQTIVFDGITNNVGNRYNPATGQFICDKPGVYVFYCRVLVVAGVGIYSLIVKNGLTIDEMYTHDADTWGHSATMTVLHLNVGDVVWVKTRESQEHSLTGDILDSVYTTFAGFLLHSDQ